MQTPLLINAGMSENRKEKRASTQPETPLKRAFIWPSQQQQLYHPSEKMLSAPRRNHQRKKMQSHLRQIPFSISLRKLALKFERNFTKIIHSDVFYPPLILTSLNSSRITTTLPTPDARLAINCIQQTRSPSVITTLQVIWQ